MWLMPDCCSYHLRTNRTMVVLNCLRNTRAIHLRPRDWFPGSSGVSSSSFSSFSFSSSASPSSPPASSCCEGGGYWFAVAPLAIFRHGRPSTHLLSLCRQVVEYRAQDLSILIFR